VSQRLDLSDPHLLEFDAEVIAERRLGDRAAVVLDRTAFYPEGGGQPADRGTIGGVPVSDVQEVGGEVLHALEGAPPSGRVACRVDRARRLDHMQQHHGQHLLSAAFEARRGARTLSFHLGGETSTIDLDAPAAALDAAALREVEAWANDAVFRDLPVEARDLSEAELAALPLRREPARGSRVVVVGAPGAIVDASPCGGTHPRRTGEVGGIAILRAQKWGAGARVEFVCGGRVVGALARAGERLAAAAQALRCAPAEVPDAAQRAADELAVRRREADRLGAAIAEAEAVGLAGAAAGPDVAIRAVLAPPGPAAAHLRAVAATLAARGRTAFLGAVEDGRAYLCFARPRGPGANLAEAVRAAAGRLGGKGGGAPDLAQGSGPLAEELPAALDAAAAAAAVTAGG
jgi:alanyl-tRNA synthetase